MKPTLLISLFLLASLLMGCNKTDREPQYSSLKIVKEFEPLSTIIDWGGMTSEERHQYPHGGFVINSSEDFPENTYADMADLKKMNIDFDRYTLLVQFSLIPGYIQKHLLLYYYDNVDSAYVFQSTFKMIGEGEPLEDDMFTYYRSAILVDKLPSTAKVLFSTTSF